MIGKDRGATHAATVASPIEEIDSSRKKVRKFKPVAGGFCCEDDVNDPLKNTHSLAACFAAWAGASGHFAAVLYVNIGDGERIIVVVLNGLPTFDKVVGKDADAHRVVRSYIDENPGISVFADDNVQFPGSLMADGLLEAIAQAVSKTTILRALPVDVLKAAVVLAGVAIGIGVYVFIDQYQKEERVRQQMARIRESAVEPKYLEALAAQRKSVGLTRDSLINAFEAAKKIPIQAGGWSLRKVSCELARGCEAEFERGTGTFKTLTAAIGFLNLDRDVGVDLNRARMTWDQPFEVADAPADADLPLGGMFFNGESGSQFQEWTVAGLGVEIQAPMLWPEIAGLNQSFKHPQAIDRGRLVAANVLLPLVGEVMRSAPGNVVWHGWKIDVGDGKIDVMSSAKASITGVYYVRHP